MPFDDSNFFERGKELNPYLKCTYGKGMFSSEYIIRFKIIRDEKVVEDPLIIDREGTPTIDVSALQNNMFVNKKNVEPLKGNEGLMKLFTIYEHDAEKSLVGISNIDGISRRYVPNSEIVWI